MKMKNKPHYLVMALVVAILAATTWSCNKNNDPTLTDIRKDKLSYLEDSVRIADSLSRANAAGIVNYAITVVSGSTSTLFKSGISGGRSAESKSAVNGAVVTISQFGKVVKDTTDDSGMVVFTGFFRTAVNVTIEKAGFTKVSYIALVNNSDSTENGGIFFVGNIIPIFELTGANTATISGKATIQTDLRNRTKELVPDGTTLSVSIDATDSDFSDMFLTSNVESVGYSDNIYVGNILDASYATGIVGTVANGLYTITVPAAIDGLPLSLQYSELALDQTLYVDAGWFGVLTPGDRTGTYRNIFAYGSTPSAIPPGSDADISFESYTSQASAIGVTSPTAGTLDKINVTNGGSNYIVATPPIVEIVGGGGTGATATAAVGANGTVTGITIINPGTGYTTAPSANIISGGLTSTASATLDGNLQQVFSISVTAQGTGYTSAPTVVFTGASTTAATATAQISNGRVIAVIVTSGGTGYAGAPTITFTGGGGAGATATASMGMPIASVTVINPGSGHVYAPKVTFSAPEFFNGIRATGTAIIDLNTRTVLGIQITSLGSGYINPPTVTLDGGELASTQVFLSGGSVISANILSTGSGYTAAPSVVFVGGGGSGAVGTAVMANGTVVGVNVTNGGSGYTGVPEIQFVSGDGAAAFPTVINGAVTGITVSDGGRNFTGAPRVIISSSVGGGAVATATVAGGQITGITVTTGGTGYLDGNTPGFKEWFTATHSSGQISVKPGLKYINDIHYGTGKRTTP